jgi:ribosomal protein L7Ae-like RNA K-turn-binding protein
MLINNIYNTIYNINLTTNITNNATNSNIITTCISNCNDDNIQYKYIFIKWLLTASIIVNVMQYINSVNDYNKYKNKQLYSS